MAPLHKPADAMGVATVGGIGERTAIAVSASHRNRLAREHSVQAGIRGSQLLAPLDPNCEFLFEVRRHGTEHQLGGCAAATIGAAVGKPSVIRPRGPAISRGLGDTGTEHVPQPTAN